MDDLEKIILQTLSFYDALTLEEIILQMDKGIIDLEEVITVEDLEKKLQLLARQRKVKVSGRGKERRWIRKLPKRGIFYKIKSMFGKL